MAHTISGAVLVQGAQDNCVQFSYNATPAKRANGFIFGDGAATAVDASVSPPRFYGCTQFLGQVADADAPHRRRRLGLGPMVEEGQQKEEEKEDDEEEEEGRVSDDDRASFGYLTYDPATGKSSYTGIPLLDHFHLD